MKLDKADMPKVIALGALIAVVLGYGLYTMVGRKASAASAPQSVREAAVKSPASAPKSAKPDPVKAPDQAIQATQAPPAEQASIATAEAPVQTKDPFAPCMSTTQVAYAAPTQPLPRPGGFRLPQFRTTGPMGLGIRPIGTASMPDVKVVETDPKFDLTGVINGAVNVAIIRDGDSRYIVREGQFIAGRYLVKFIGRDRVVLTRGTRSINLKLGGTNAS